MIKAKTDTAINIIIVVVMIVIDDSIVGTTATFQGLDDAWMGHETCRLFG
jgi:hypothetical protein